MQAEGDTRTKIQNVHDFYVRSANGGQVPLGALVRVDQITGPEFIQRFNEYNGAQINITGAPGYSSGQLRAALDQVFRESMPAGMGYSYQGMSFQEQRAAEGVPAWMVFGLSILIVFLILAALYESWTLPFSVLLSTPVAILGAYLALTFRSLENDIFATIGLIMLIGLSAKNATFLRLSKFPYENAIEDVTHHLEVRERDFAVLDIAGSPRQPVAPDASAVIAPGARVNKLENGFFSISGAAVDAVGKLYFVDHHNQRIYSWSENGGLVIERDNPLDPVNLAFDNSGNLLVLSSAGPEGTVYTFHPGSSVEELTVLKPQPAQSHAKASVILPVNWWNNGEFKDQLNLDTMRFSTLAEMFVADATTPKAREYVSTDGSVFLPAGRVFQQGPATDTSGWRFSDGLDTYGFLRAAPGQRVYVSSESEDVTYNAKVNPDGTLTDLQPFAQRGGESVVVDNNGNVYVANGQIFVYSPSGKQIAQIDVPERPLQLIFGGADRKTLFILAHHALFAAEVR